MRSSLLPPSSDGKNAAQTALSRFTDWCEGALVQGGRRSCVAACRGRLVPGSARRAHLSLYIAIQRRTGGGCQPRNFSDASFVPAALTQYITLYRGINPMIASNAQAINSIGYQYNPPMIVGPDA